MEKYREGDELWIFVVFVDLQKVCDESMEQVDETVEEKKNESK